MTDKPSAGANEQGHLETRPIPAPAPTDRELAEGIAKRLNWPDDWYEHVNESGAWGLKDCFNELLRTERARLLLEQQLAEATERADLMRMEASKESKARLEAEAKAAAPPATGQETCGDRIHFDGANRECDLPKGHKGIHQYSPAGSGEREQGANCPFCGEAMYLVSDGQGTHECRNPKCGEREDAPQYDGPLTLAVHQSAEFLRFAVVAQMPKENLLERLESLLTEVADVRRATLEEAARAIKELWYATLADADMPEGTQKAACLAYKHAYHGLRARLEVKRG